MANTSNVTDQHTTPRFYLRGFADPNEPAFIWQYYKGGRSTPATLTATEIRSSAH
jgi:hypothetical protein